MNHFLKHVKAVAVCTAAAFMTVLAGPLPADADVTPTNGQVVASTPSSVTANDPVPLTDAEMASVEGEGLAAVIAALGAVAVFLAAETLSRIWNNMIDAGCSRLHQNNTTITVPKIWGGSVSINLHNLAHRIYLCPAH